MDAYLIRILANHACSEISDGDLRRARQKFRRFFLRVALPYLSHPTLPKNRRTRSRELADMALHYFFEPGQDKILEGLSRSTAQFDS
jgi:hypothetical protein